MLSGSRCSNFSTRWLVIWNCKNGKIPSWRRKAGWKFCHNAEIWNRCDWKHISGLSVEIPLAALTNDNQTESFLRYTTNWNGEIYFYYAIVFLASGIASSTNRRCWTWQRVPTALLKETNYTIKRNTKRRFSTRNFRSDTFFLALMVIIQTIRFRFFIRRKRIWNCNSFHFFFEGRRNVIFFADKGNGQLWRHVKRLRATK